MKEITMKTFLRIAVLVCVGFCLFAVSPSFAQKQDKSPAKAKQQDKILSKAQKMLQSYKPPQDYKPPQPTNTAPKETPAQAWKSSYQQKHQPKGKLSADERTKPSVNQYRKKGFSEALQKRVAEAKPLTLEERKKQAAELMQKEMQKPGAKGLKPPTLEERKKLAEELTQKELQKQKPDKGGFLPSQHVTKEQMQARIQETVQQEEQQGHGEAYQLQKRHLSRPQQLTKEQIKAIGDELMSKDGQKHSVVPRGVPTQEELKQSGKAAEEKARKEQIGRFSPRKQADVTQTSVIQGMAWNDLNHDGVKDSSEPGLSGWTVYLQSYYNGGTISTTTDSTGLYQFTGLGEDGFYPYFQDPSGWYRTWTNGWTWYWPTGSDTISGINAGYWQIAGRTISGTVFNDANRNGVRDSLESGLAGWTVRLYEYYTGANYYATTDSAGYYHFDNLQYFYYYYIDESGIPFGWWETSPTSPYTNYYNYYYTGFDSIAGSDFGNWQIPPTSFSGTVFNDINNSGTRDSGEVGVAGWQLSIYRSYDGTWHYVTTDTLGNYTYSDTGYYGYYTVYDNNQFGWLGTYPWRGQSIYWQHYFVGDSVSGWDFGNWLIGRKTITGTVFEDVNDNGIRDDGEPGLSNWQVAIYRNDGNYFYVNTDTNGTFVYSDSGYANWYEIWESNPFGYQQTSPWQANGADYWFYADSGTYAGRDFGNWLIGNKTITGTVYNDMNNNSSRDPGEPGLSGWTVGIYRSYDGAYFYLQTDTGGTYTYSDSGYYCNYEIWETTQDGWFQTTPQRYQGAYYWFTASSGTYSGYDFGNWNVGPSSIRGSKFSDLNDNGVRDDGEPGLAGWTIHAYNTSTGVTLTTTTDTSGNFAFDSLSWVYNYQVYEDQQLDWVKTCPGGSYYYVSVGGDTVTGIDFGNYLPPAGPLRVNTMPSSNVSTTYANALVSMPLAVWGNVHGGLVPLHYVLDYGDGTADSGLVTDRRFIGSMHAYTSAGPKPMSLTVTDANGAVSSSQSVVRVYAASSQQIQVNMAIEKGLLYQYLNQYPDGSWYDGYGHIPATGADILAFEENGHVGTNDIRTDIYAEYVQMGLNYLFASVATMGIGPQTAGNPDSDGDGIGAYFSGDTYANGIAGLAVIGSHSNAAAARADTIRVGSYNGQTYYDLMVDVIDLIAYSQGDVGEYGRGGWRYCANCSTYGSSDNSAAQWPALVMEAGQNSWGMAVPQFVKDELLIWLQWSQGSDGGFGYTDPGNWDNPAKTGSGIGGYAFLGYQSSSTPVANAITFLDNNWNNDNFGNFYAMYAVKKGMSLINSRAGLTNINSHNWYDEYASYVVGVQYSDGSWNGGGYVGGPSPLGTAFGILILTRGVVVAPPVAVIEPVGDLPPRTAFQIDGSNSFHQDPSKSIVEWLWDWNASNGVDWKHVDASGPKPTNTGYADTGMYTITLRVKDNSDPPMYSIATLDVHITLNHHPPVAVAIPPSKGSGYAGKVGEPIFLDGTASYSPDYPKDSVVAWRWDLNGNGNYYDSSDATTDTATVTFQSPYSGQVGLRVYDTQGDSSSNVAYINIVASKTDLFVQQFSVAPESLYQGQTVNLFAIVKNNDSSNTGASHVLLRFYDDDPLTVGNQLGGDFYVDLPVSAVDTVQTSVKLPPRFKAGIRHFYVYLDANQQVAEWNEVNNMASQTVGVLRIHPITVLDRRCLNFATVPVGDSLTLPILITNVGNDTLFIDDLETGNPVYTALDGAGDSVAPGASMPIHVRFMPNEQGLYEGVLTIYSNDDVHTISLTGQGELQATGNGQQIFSGLVTVDGKIVPRFTVIGAYKKSGYLISSFLVQESPDDAMNSGFNYTLKILEGQAEIASGDTIVFKVSTLGCETLPVRYCEPMTVFNPAFPPDSGYYHLDFDAVHQRVVSARLRSGFNAVSWNVTPDDPSVTSVFGGILGTGKVRIILDYVNDGHGNPAFDFYIPALGQYNVFHMTHLTKGYFVMLSRDASPDSMTVSGIPVCPAIPIPLDSNYNLVSYLPDRPESVGVALNSLIPGNLAIALRFVNDGVDPEGFQFYPDGDFTSMTPGEGYFVKVDLPDVLIYPGMVTGKQLPSRMKIANVRPRHSAGTTPGFPSAVFAYGLHVYVDGKPVPAGTEIKAVDKDGVVCGSAKFAADGVFGMAICGDNPATSKDEGASPGELVNIYIGNKLVTERIKWTEFGDTPQLEGNLSVTNVTLGSGVPKEYALHQNYPNPFNPTTSISYDLPISSDVTLKIYNLLGAEVRTLVAGTQETGYYQIVWDGRNGSGIPVASGTYTYRLVATSGSKSFVQTHKMILMK